jgi:hypothetical protein
MEEDNKETITWRSSASDLGNIIPTQIEEKIEDQLNEQLKLEESNVIFYLFQSHS